MLQLTPDDVEEQDGVVRLRLGQDPVIAALNTSFGIDFAAQSDLSVSEELDRRAGFSEVLTTWAWWDRPRSGVTLINGEPHRFICNFDEALDDYPDEYRLWPISTQELDAELAFWRLWVEWRGSFDSGARPEPFERRPDYASLKAALAGYREPPIGARSATPEWRLDGNRSFAGRVPRYFVRWTFIEPE